MTCRVGPSTIDLAGLVAAARTLYERVDDPVTPVTDPGQLAGAISSSNAGGRCRRPQPDGFGRRLALDGWTESMIAPYLAEAPRPVGAELPRWALVLEGCVDAVLASACEDPRRDVLPGHPPRLFEQVFSPVVRHASAELGRRSPTARGLLSPAALADAETSLLDSLVQASTPTLTLEFQAFRSAHEPTLFRMLRRVKNERSSELYREFVRRLRSDGLVDLLSTYPVLGRCWGVLVQTWIDTLAEMLDRLERDRVVLSARLGVSLGVPGLDHVTMAMSDRHRGGRSVMRLDFGGGTQILYKPKGLRLERAFCHLLRWLNRRGAPVTLRAIEVVDRGDYGWVEYVEAAECGRREDVATYYRRAGALLCLVHLLDGTDCHLENIVAAGPDPVLVDAEALLHHRVAAGHSAGGARQIDVDANVVQQHRRSVLRTGMLPGWTLDDGGNPVDTSGLGGFGEQATERQLLHWGAREQRRAPVSAGVLRRLPPAHNVPTLDSVPQSPLDFRNELVAGFTQMYRFCQRHTTALTHPDGPLHRAHAWSKPLHRPGQRHLRQDPDQPARAHGLDQRDRADAASGGPGGRTPDRLGAVDRWPWFAPRLPRCSSSTSCTSAPP